MNKLLDHKKVTKSKFKSDAIKTLTEKGVVHIRNLFSSDTINGINKLWDIHFKAPSISGTVGYSQTSHKLSISK